MSELRLVCLGVGDAFSRLWYTSALALRCEGQWLLIDCPHPIRKILAESGASAGEPLDVDSIAGVVLTHLHADHASGLEGFAFYNHFALGRKTVLLAHPAVLEPLWERQLAVTMSRLSLDPAAPASMQLTDYFDIRPLDEARATTFGPFSIECRLTRHPVPTFALRLSGGGRCLGHSSDTAFDPGLIDWLSASDLILHETNLGVHTPYADLAALPEPLRRRMRLTHYPDNFAPSPPAIELLVQGQAYDV